jgi:hypothetical protein
MTLKALTNAARLSAHAGDLTDARALGERGGSVASDAWADHPDALLALSVLGSARAGQGEHEPA